MIDTLKFYRANLNSSSFYRRHNSRLSAINDEKFLYEDKQELIERFRSICKPPEVQYDQNNNEFILLCFWLNKNGFTINEFPNVLSRPTSLQAFAYEDIRKYIQSKRGPSDKVQWSERRELCDSITITSNSTFQLMPNDIEDKIKLVSTRGAEFDEMSVEEKLQNLNNLIENLLKPTSAGKYLALNYDEIFYGFITEEDVKKFRKRTQVFRHATEDSLKERDSIPAPEKKYLSEMGVFIAIHLYEKILKN